MVRLRTVVSQLSIVDGALRKSAPNLGVMEPTSLIPLKRDRGNLYVVIEAMGEVLGRDEAYHQMMEAIREKYFGIPGSITFGLCQAIEAANSYLFKENMNSPREMRRGAGLTCAVLRGNDLYIGQAGPTLAYVIHQRELERFPKHAPWLEKIGTHPSPLGVEEKPEIELFHCRVEPGDTILFSSSSLAQVASEEKVMATLAGEGMALENLANLAAGRDLSSIIVELPVAEAESLAPPKGERRPRPVREQVLKEEVEPRVEEAVPARRPVPRMQIDVSAFLGRIGRTVAGSLAALAGGLRVMVRRILPEAGAPSKARPKRARTSPEGRKALIGLAIAIPILIAAMVAFVYFQQERERNANFAQLVEGAESKIEQALAETERGTIRSFLNEAESLVNGALQIKPEDAEALALRDEIQAKLDEVNAVERLDQLSVLTDFPAESEPGRVVVKGIDVYVLDKGLNRVYKYLFDKEKISLKALENPILLRQGDQRGDIVVGELIDMVWMEAGGEWKRSNLLVLESGGWLLEYAPEREPGLAVLPVAESQSWGWPKLTGSYFGNFYLLDSQLNQILKYIPTPDGYNQPPIKWLKPEIEVDLAGAVDMAIDGYIYVLLADGTILKFAAGQQLPFDQTEIDQPLRSPTAIFAAIETEHLYIADTGNERIVQFTKDGHFMRQFLSKQEDVLAQLRSFFVDEADGRLYFTSGNKLYIASIPPEG